jgi:hypothetical protein
MPRIANKQELLNHMGEEHAEHFKVAGWLLAAHGGGLGTSLTVLRDYVAAPQFKGVGVFIILFGSGLAATVFYYASVFLIRATVRNALMNDEDPNDSPSAGFLKILNVVSIAVALLALLAAIGLIIWRAAFL